MIGNLLLLITAAIWGFAFVAQRQGMQSLDPFTYNAIRFALGALFVRAVLQSKWQYRRKMLFLPGFVLFVAASLQQIGIVYTSAGAAGFITGLYVVFVPLLGLFRKQKIDLKVATAIFLCLIGMYLMNDFSNLDISLGNLFVLISSVFWAVHVQLVDKYSKSEPIAVLAVGQFSLCSVLSGISAVVYLLLLMPEMLSVAKLGQGIHQALIPILYGGLMSVGIAYTLQIRGQRDAHPTAAAVIMSMEGPFALLGGWLILQEKLSLRILVGSLFLLIAMLLVSLPKKVIDRNAAINFSVRT